MRGSGGSLPKRIKTADRFAGVRGRTGGCHLDRLASITGTPYSQKTCLPQRHVTRRLYFAHPEEARDKVKTNRRDAIVGARRVRTLGLIAQVLPPFLAGEVAAGDVAGAL